MPIFNILGTFEEHSNIYNTDFYKVTDKYTMVDEQIRVAAFEWLKIQCGIFNDILPRKILEEGFLFQQDKITLLGASGIWKPRQLKSIPISITTVLNGPYSDRMSTDGFLTYKYRGTDPKHRDNVGLRLAIETRTPLIYFVSISPGKYVTYFPAFIVQDNPYNLEFTVALDDQNSIIKQDKAEDNINPAEFYRRKYITSTIQVRLHQQSFRERVITAYNNQCCLCKINHIELLDASHIIPDTEPNGIPIVPNGLTLCKIHHAAFDSNIIGITPDYEIKVRSHILAEIDGPMLKHGIQELHNHKIILPNKRSNHPDRDRLEWRYERFRKTG